MEVSLVEITLVKQDDDTEEKVKNFTLCLRSFEDDGVTFEIPKGYVGDWDDIYYNDNEIPYDSLQPGKYIFKDGTVYRND